MITRALELARRSTEIMFAMAKAHLPIRRGARHGLDRELIVNLTSYPSRFPTLHLTLRCLLNQSVSPDRLILWIAELDLAAVPAAVRALESNGLDIRTCDDLRSFKKIIPALHAFPDAYLVTADDDLFYPRYWLATLVDAALPSTNDIIAHTVRRPKYIEGRFATIWDWNMNAVDPRTQYASDDIFPCTGAGVLYPPDSLHTDTVNLSLINELCPTCDDSWLAWMARRKGTLVRRSKTKRWSRLVAWRGTNAGSLSAENFATDRQTLLQDQINQKLAAKFGLLNSLRND